MWKVQLFDLNYDHREARAVADVINSGWITMGERTKEFEERFAEFLGGDVLCLATSNGTAALHMSLLALDIGPGDEVIISALTFVADINVVMMVGATPILADCTSLDDWNVCQHDISRKITSRTKAVLLVHYGGFACNMDGIKAVIKEKQEKYNKRIFLIEDAAHAPGADYKGHTCGTFGDIACFSFFSNKNLSVGEGGMFVTRSRELEQRGKYLRSHGMSTLTLDRHKGRAISYDVVQPGLNYRIDEIRAALGLVQLDKLVDANKKRGALFQRYYDSLDDFSSIYFPFRKYNYGMPSYHIFPILLKKGLDRDLIINILKVAGVQTSIHYPAFGKFSAYKKIGLKESPVAQDISSRELTLPLYPTMSFEQVDIVCKALEKAIG